MTTKRNVYLNMKPLDEAREILFDHFPAVGTMPAETVSPPDAVGRILAEPVTAKVSSPNFHAAAMDGVAVKAEDTFGASETRPKELQVGSQARFLNTGHVMPPDTDAVIMIENIQRVGDDRIRIEAPAFPWQHVRKMGEDIVATELLYPRGHLVSPYCVGALISGGIYDVPVRRKLRVLIIPTGSELVDWRPTAPENLKPGQVLETNAYVLEKMIAACGGHAVRHERVMDDLALIRQTVNDAVAGDFDMVMTIGGSSAGSEDYALPVLQDLGEMLVHGVTIMPGKPVLLGDIQGKPFFGIPGYPVSAIIALEQFVQPLIRRVLGAADEPRRTVAVVPTRKIASKLGVEEFLRVKLGQVGENIVATPLPRGAGMITSITEADGIIRIPNHLEGVKENETVTASLLRPLGSIEKTLVVVGSHDNTLDVLADQLRAEGDGEITLSSSHVGSMGGLMAIKRGVCHLAGAHLLDIEDGSYNISYVHRFLSGVEVRIVNLVFRDQGLIVGRGNPKDIRDIEDLVRDDIRFVNRQGGSGTRILLDYRLAQLGIDPARIAGYADEEFTHMATAAAVLSGAADVGLGIYAAARALHLDFIPVVTEQYDLIIPEAYMDWRPMTVLLETIHSAAFKDRVKALGGYSTQKTGQVMFSGVA